MDPVAPGSAAVEELEQEEVEELAPAMDEHFADPLAEMGEESEETVGIDHSGRQLQPLRDPRNPTASEVLEHNRTHLLTGHGVSTVLEAGGRVEIIVNYSPQKIALFLMWSWTIVS